MIKRHPSSFILCQVDLREVYAESTVGEPLAHHLRRNSTEVTRTQRRRGHLRHGSNGSLEDPMSNASDRYTEPAGL